MRQPIQGVLFDLDGTLLDTAPDLGSALNQVLKNRGLPQLPHAVIRPLVGMGAKTLIKLGFNLDDTHEDYPVLIHELLKSYHLNEYAETAFFPGVEEVLQHLDDKNIPWGIVTNRTINLTTNLVEKFALHHRAKCIISGDTLKHPKPHPDPILHGCKLLGLEPNACVYIGDAHTDIIASRAAGTLAVAALYGYISAHENPQSWLADAYIEQPIEILSWLTDKL